MLQRGVAVDSLATAAEAPCELPTNVKLELGKAADVVSADLGRRPHLRVLQFAV